MGQLINLIRNYPYHVNDLAVAAYRVAVRHYGKDVIRGVRGRFYGRMPINLVSVKDGCHSETEGIIGGISVKNFTEFFHVGGPKGHDPVIQVQVRAGRQKEVEALLNDIQTNLERESIYKGKAVTSDREFLDLSGVSMDNVVYNAKVLRQLKAHAWTIIEDPERCLDGNVPLQRKVLFQGPFGSGKTLAAFLTAQKAVRHGWTVMYLEPTAEKESGWLEVVFAFARQYQPAVVIIDDIDREQRHENSYVLGKICTIIDGMTSKNAQILTIMTTNYPAKIAGSMLRPGRIDKPINFGIYNAEDAERLLRVTIPEKMLSPEIDWTKVTEGCKDYSPVFVQEVGKSSVLLAISEAEHGNQGLVTGEMLLESADDLRAQWRAGAKELGFCSNQE